MKKALMAISTLLLSMGAFASEAEIADINSPLKSVYSTQDGARFFHTGKTVDSYSIICDMGQAIPDSGKEGWYTNKAIPGLHLELRARAAHYSAWKVDLQGKPTAIANGFVVIAKDNEILKTFYPLGNWINGKWEGDVFNSWNPLKSDIEVFSQMGGIDGYANFDLMSGNGFYYKAKGNSEPDYFLSRCHKIKKQNLPIYDWDFHFSQ